MERILLWETTIALHLIDLEYLTECARRGGEDMGLTFVCPDCMQNPAEAGTKPGHVMMESGRVAIGCEGVHVALVDPAHNDCIVAGHCHGDH